jgi:glycosyltransferase involved in cell wall biosynthesis
LDKRARELTRLKKTPIVLEIEDLPLARRREWFNMKPWLDQWCWNDMLKMASAFTAVNEPIFDLLPNDKPRYLLPGVIDEHLVTRSRSRQPPFNNSQRTLGYFGGLGHEKGCQALIDLVPQLPSEWRLMVTGSGSLAGDFERLSKEYPDQLLFLGYLSVTQLYEAMCACDCTVIPLEQTSEGGRGVFPFKTLEFVVAGTHVIASPLPALRDLDLSFIQRWDGCSVDSLLAELFQAESEFRREQSAREKAIATILTRYSLSGVANRFSALLSGRLAVENGAPICTKG